MSSETVSLKLRGPARRLILGFALLAAAAMPSWAQGGSGVGTGELPVVRRYEDFSEMSGDRRQLEHPIELEGDVLYVDPGWRMMFVRTGSWMHYIETADRQVAVRPGQRVRITGVHSPTTYLLIDKIRFEILGPLPDRDVPRLEAVVGADRPPTQEVIASGIVDRQTVADDTHINLDVASGGSTYVMTVVVEPGAPLPNLTGAYIRARGLYNPRRDVSHLASGFEVLVAEAGHIEVTGWLATDPDFQRTVTAIGELATQPPDADVLVVGAVRARTPGQSITLRDDTGQVVVRTGQSAEIGARLAAVGRPRVDGLNLLLEGARLRPADQAPVVTEALGLPILRMNEQVLALPESRSVLGGPVMLAGGVAWSDPASRHIYLLDSTGGVRVQLPADVEPPPFGAMVSVAGRTEAGTFAPAVVATSLRVIGRVELTEARDISYEQALTGMEDGQWVALRGLVRAVGDDGARLHIELSTPGGDLSVLAPRDTSLARHVGAIVRARGICVVQADARRRLSGVQLWLPSADHLFVEEPAPADPFALPETAIARMRSFTTLETANRRIRITGTVTHHEPGRYLHLEDGVDAIQVLSTATEALLPGDRIEAVGLPGSDAQRLVLREAVLRRIGAGREPAPARIDEHLLPDPAFEGRLVRLNARLLERIGTQETHLVLERDDTVFPARLEARDAGLDGIEPHSIVEVTGLYSIVRDEYRRARGFVLQLRRGDDIRVIEQPPWLNSRRAGALAGALVVVLLLAIFWVQSLRRRVRRQTEQIRAQLASEAELKTRQRDILENANDCIFTTDLAGRLTAFNRAGERLTGYTREEALGLHLRDLFGGAEDCARALAQLRAEEGAGGGATFETRFRRKDGEVVWVEVSSRLVAVDGRPTGLLGIVRDVSERRKFEAELSAARDAAQASTAAKSAFLANMSHEIRTPMNGVIGMSNLLLDTPLAREQRDFAETIRDSAEGLLTILNDILDFSKIEAGKLEFESVPFDVAATVDGTLELLAARAAAKGLEIAAYVPRTVPVRLVGDPGRLRQVLLNLVGNAIKFTETGEVVVHVACVAVQAGVATLRFEVIDTGPGLSREAQTRMFRPFEQADSSTTRRFGGTGLGLAICRQIVELMCGQIGVRSVPGEGSTFWFTARFACDTAAPEAAPVTLKDGRILLLDANAATRRINADHLGAWDATVVGASGAEEALAAARVAADDRRTFDLAVADLASTGSAGLAGFAAALRALPGCAALRVIGLVPVDRRATGDVLSAPGVAGLLAKPIRRDALIEAVRNALASGDPLEPATEPPAPVSAEPSRATPPAVPDDAPARVLVVEDNIVNQRVARLLLGKLGVRIDLAGNGVEALAALERGGYEAVFMDCQMPEMDGYEATRRIRADERFAGLRVIAMTANAMEGDRERCLAAGMDDYVSKPMRPEELRAALERAEVLPPRT